MEIDKMGERYVKGMRIKEAGAIAASRLGLSYTAGYKKIWRAWSQGTLKGEHIGKTVFIDAQSLADFLKVRQELK
jgi:hypothetical protein